MLQVPHTLHPPDIGCVAEPLVQMLFLVEGLICLLQPPHDINTARKNTLREDKAKPWHINSCAWKPRRKQRRKLVVLCFEIMKSHVWDCRVELERWHTSHFSFEYREYSPFSLSWSENSTSFGRYGAGFLPAVSLAPSHSTSFRKIPGRFFCLFVG